MVWVQPSGLLERNAAWPKRYGRAARCRKPDSGHADTISLTIRVRRARRNVMKSQFQCVLTQ
jgi:hypothetical protein